jgi:hypothetical protein
MCIDDDDVSDWMRSNRLQLNMDKTEFIWCTTSRRQHSLPTTNIKVGSTQVTPSTSVRDLGIFIDSDLVMRTHVQRTVSRCFAMLRRSAAQYPSIGSNVYYADPRRQLGPQPTSLRKRHTSWTSDLPSTSAGVSVERVCQIDLYDLRRSDHVTDALASLHWLRVLKPMTYKTALLMFRAPHGEAPEHLSEKLACIADISSPRRLRSTSTSQLMVPRYRPPPVGSRSLSVAGPTIWNRLPTDITSSSCLFEFKPKLKTHFFRLSYPNNVQSLYSGPTH